MADPIITLTTDFGEDSPYVAAMKGVILTINPAARIVDLSHQIPPQDLRHAAFFLAESIPCFPAEAIHVAVIDPGVGSERALLYVEMQSIRLLVPDNGCWTMLQDQPRRVIQLTNRRYWRSYISSTFHGRDILAPVAAHLSLGIDSFSLGPVVNEWQRLETKAPRRLQDTLAGEVIFVDHFGNLITNIPGDWVPEHITSVQMGESDCHQLDRVRTYCDRPSGHLVGLVSSSGLFEIAIVQGNASAHLHAAVGTPILLELK
jgi:S-adenosylmethionine hydrolase